MQQQLEFEMQDIHLVIEKVHQANVLLTKMLDEVAPEDHEALDKLVPEIETLKIMAEQAREYAQPADWEPEPVIISTNHKGPCDVCGEPVLERVRAKVPYPPGHGTDQWGHGSGMYVHLACTERAKQKSKAMVNN